MNKTSQHAANSTNSESVAQRACIEFQDGYQHNVATVSQQQHYAQCVNLLNPIEVDASAPIALKLAIVAIFVGALIGGVYGWLKDECPGDTVFGAGCGALAVIAVEMVLAFSALGLQVVFS